MLDIHSRITPRKSPECIGAPGDGFIQCDWGAVEDVQGNAGAGFGVGKGVVVPLQRDAEVAGDGGEFVVGQVGVGFARLVAGAIEAVFLRRQAVGGEHGAQAAGVERAVVRNERQAGNFRQHFLPDRGEGRRAAGVGGADAVDAGVEGAVVVGNGPNQVVIAVHEAAVCYEDEADAAYAAGIAVSSFKIEGDKVLPGA